MAVPRMPKITDFSLVISALDHPLPSTALSFDASRVADDLVPNSVTLLLST